MHVPDDMVERKHEIFLRSRQSTQATELCCKYCIGQCIRCYENVWVCMLLICTYSHGHSAEENEGTASYREFN
jgi:hypothetical protein